MAIELESSDIFIADTIIEDGMKARLSKHFREDQIPQQYRIVK